MTLLETQRRMAAALMTPWTAKDGPAREAARLLKPNSRMTALERLEIYSRSYWQRLVDALREDFPGLERILGPARLERLARAYLTDCPSRRFTLRDLGSKLEPWLRAHPRYAAGRLGPALDMARLEWAHIVAFDGPEEMVLGPEHLAEPRPDLRAGVQQYIGLLDLQYPVDEIRIRANACGAEAGGEAVLRRARPERVFLAVHRLDCSVYYRRLRAEEFRLLSALRAGQTMAGAIGAALKGSTADPDEVPGLLRDWFAAWAQFGWLTVRGPEKGGTRK